MLLGATGAYLLVGMVPVSTPDAPWFLFISGTVAICAMILPGISGSFILVLMGKYHYVLEAVNNRDLFTLMLVAAGACLGLIVFSRFLNWILKKYHDITIAILTGLMLGSLRKVWPWKKTIENITERDGGIVAISQANTLPSQWNDEVMVAIGLMAIGFLVVFFMNLWAEKKD
jgi:putative membrane protein